jgi:hypothetical protein
MAAGIAHQKGGEPSDILDGHELVLRDRRRGPFEQLVEAVDAAGSAGRDRAWRDRMGANALGAKLSRDIAGRARGPL